METKRHYKLYKKGKLWCCSAIILAMAVVGLTTTGESAHAAVSTFPQETTVETSTVGNNIPTQVDSQANEADSGMDKTANVGNLDSYQITEDPTTGEASLDFSGWHASGESEDRSYRYAILFDNTNNTEISRQPIQSVDRPDVEQVYSNVPNSEQSGFNNRFMLPADIAGHTVTLVTRYSDNPSGEGNNTDFWFNPIVIDNRNQAVIDSISSNTDGKVTVSGWHASNQAVGKKYHYIIAFDQTTGKEIARQATSLIQRPDVAQAFPTVANANLSGFNVSFQLTPEYSRDNIQFISRWTDDPAGNGNMTDYWFAPVNKVNRGFLDSFDLSSGQLVVSGWHANDASVYQPFHYLILVDTTTGQQVASAQVPTSESGDVAAAFPGMVTAGRARFSYNFGQLALCAGHSYSLVSRYSTSNQGNGDDGNTGDYDDYWYSLGTLNKSAGNIDSCLVSGDQVTVTGWLASDGRINEAIPYIIVLRNGSEITRQKLSLTNRLDVAAAYPQIYGSLQSGFNTTIQLPANITDGDLQLVLRFSDSEDGEGNHTDIWMNNIKNGLVNDPNIRVTDGVLYRTDDSGNIINIADPSNIQISRISIDGDLTGISKDNKKNVKINLALINGEKVDAWATIKWQGNSTLGWPKKGYRIKLFKDEAMSKKLKLELPGSGFKTNSFNLKANFTDPTAGLNIVNARLFSEMTANRANLEDSIVASMPNYGQVVGLPVELDINNYDQGLYVLETYQEDKLYNLDDKKSDNIALSDQQSPLSRFTQPFTPDNLQEAEFEAKSPAKVDQSVADKFNELYKLANASYAEYEMLENEYLDVPAAIDYLVLGAVINNIDGITKNITYVNKENSKWVIMPYDLDASWNNSWNGTSMPLNADFFAEIKNNQNRLLIAIYNHHQQDIINRYRELRTNVLSTANVTSLFNQWFDEVGTTAYQNNDQLWGNINITGQTHRLAIDKATFDNTISQRLAAVDQQFGL